MKKNFLIALLVAVLFLSACGAPVAAVPEEENDVQAKASRETEKSNPSLDDTLEEEGEEAVSSKEESNLETDEIKSSQEGETSKDKQQSNLITITANRKKQPGYEETNTEKSSKTDKTKKKKTEDKDSEEDKSRSTPLVLSDSVYDTQVEYDGTIYQVPMTVKQLTAEGWTLDGDESTVIPSKSSTIAYFKSGKDTITTTLINFDINEQPITNCHVTRMEFDFMYLKEEKIARTTGDIELLKSTREEVIAAFGTPTSEFESDSGSASVEYSQGYNLLIRFYFFESEEGKLTSIRIENSVQPDDFETSDVSDEVPSFIADYKTPTALSNQLEDFVVEFGGNFYQLPAH